MPSIIICFVVEIVLMPLIIVHCLSFDICKLFIYIYIYICKCSFWILYFSCKF
jgi:hypothetical protein